MGRRRSPTRLQESRERRPARRAGLTRRTAAQRRREGPCRPAVTVRRRCGASHGGTEVTAARKSRRHGSHCGTEVTAARKSRRHGGGIGRASALERAAGLGSAGPTGCGRPRPDREACRGPAGRCSRKEAPLWRREGVDDGGSTSDWRVWAAGERGSQQSRVTGQSWAQTPAQTAAPNRRPRTGGRLVGVPVPCRDPGAGFSLPRRPLGSVHWQEAPDGGRLDPHTHTPPQALSP